MHYFDHDKLHELMDANETTKKMSDEIHAEPKPNSFEEMLTSKQKMIGVYTLAVGCNNLTTAKEHVEKVIQLFKKHFTSWENYQKVKGSPEFSQALKELKTEYEKNQKCCSAGGNDYICFCRKQKN